MVTDLNLLAADLETDEGFRGEIYDDASGAPIKPGSIVKGHPTAGHGFAFDVSPLTLPESRILLRSRSGDAAAGLRAAVPWVQYLSEPRQRALSNMAYNMGVTGLMKFDTFMALMQRGDFDEAADDLESTKWYAQVGDRAKRIQALIKNG